MKTKTLSLILVLVLCLGLLPSVAFAAGSNFTIENGVLTKYNGKGGDVTIPNGVTQIGDRAFYNGKNVTIPSSVTTIVSAFINCESLTDIFCGGSKEQWNAIDFMGDIDEALANATIHYNSPMPDIPVVGGFTDVKTGDWFAEPVKWAVERGITTGTSVTTFSPNNTCTKAHILTFLWRAKGEPMPTVTNPFSDVKDRSYYYNAALWAYENGLVSGNSFKPDSLCTRAQTVTYQWKLAGSPAAPAAAFTDVSSTADYAAAVAWAVEKEITTGTSATTFSPNDTCTRGQIVTFLYRDMGGSPADTDSTSNTQLMAQAMLDKLNALGDPEAYLLDMNTDGTPELVCYDKEIPDATWSEGYRVYRWDGRKLYEHQFDYSYDYRTHEKNYGQGIAKCHDGYALVYPIIGGHEGGEYVYFLDHTDTFYYGWNEYWDGEGDGEDEAFWTFNTNP